MNILSLSLSRLTSALTLTMILLVCATISGCVSLGYERELFPSDNIRVIHSDRHCKVLDQKDTTPLPNADHIETMEYGIGRFVATKTAWEVIARQLAIELDADLALISPCDGEGWSFQYAQIEMWRTRGFNPIVQGESFPERGTLMAPSHTTYGTRLQNIFECFDQARVTSAPITPENKKRLGSIDATDFFSSDPHFRGYARIDQYFRPTCSGQLSMSMIKFYRERADWSAGIYRKLSPNERALFAERYIICLLDRGYSW